MRKEFNICLASYFDHKYAMFGKLCARSMQVYADRYGYHVEIYTKPLCSRPPTWNKLLIIQELFNKGYDFVFWIDSDSVFVRFDEDIADQIEADKDLYMVKFVDHVIEGEVPNTGILLIRNSPWSKMVLEKLWGFEKYLAYKWKDQAAFVEFFGLIGKLNKHNWHFKDDTLVNIQPNEELLRKVKWMDMKWNNWEFRANVKRPMINHYAGRPHHVRLWMMMRDAQKAGVAPILMPGHVFEWLKARAQFEFQNIIKRLKRKSK
jgi:hypothetical protein